MVLNNRDLNQVTWEERMQLGAGKTESTQSIPDFPITNTPNCSGSRASSSTTRTALGAAWDEALAADRPVILEAYTDPNVPPLPPHITLKDAKNFMTMTVHEPELGSVLSNSAKEVAGQRSARKGLNHDDAVSIDSVRAQAYRDSDRQAGGGRNDRLELDYADLVEVSGGGEIGLGYTYSARPRLLS